jgi:hypothetical protein
VYSFSRAVFKRFEWIETVSGLQGHHHFLQKSKTEGGKTGLSSKGTFKTHLINGIAGIEDLGNSSSDSVDISSFNSIM